MARYSNQSDQAMKRDRPDCGLRLLARNAERGHRRAQPACCLSNPTKLAGVFFYSGIICVHAVRIRCNQHQSWRDMIKTRQGRWTGTQRVTAMIVSQRALPIVSARPSAAFSAHGPHYQIPCLRLRRKNNCSRIKICSKKLFAMLIKKCSKNKIEMI